MAQIAAKRLGDCVYALPGTGSGHRETRGDRGPAEAHPSGTVTTGKIATLVAVLPGRATDRRVLQGEGMKSLRTRVCMARLSAIGLAMALLATAFAPALATAHPGHAHTNVIANAGGDNVRLRSGPSYDDAEISRFPEGTGVDIVDGPYEAADGSIWYQVDIDGQAGYMDSAYLVAVEVPAGDPVGAGSSAIGAPRTSGLAATSAAVQLRAGPSTADTVVRTLDSGEQVMLTGGNHDGWTSVSATGGDGWVASEYLVFEAAPQAPAPSPSPEPETPGPSGTRFALVTLELRSGPGTTFDSIATMEAGTQLELSGEQDGSFVSVTSPYGEGWVTAEFIGPTPPEGSGPPVTPAPPVTPEAPVTPEPTTTSESTEVPEVPVEPEAPETPVDPEARFTTANVNLRSAASRTSTVLTVIASGTEVAFLGATAEGFAQVRTNAGDGWIATDFLSESRPATPAGPDPTQPGQALIAWPVSGGEWVISQGYNGSSHQNRTQYWQYYYSFDLKRSDGSTAGQPIYSAVNGTVRWIDEATGGMSIYMGDGLAYAFFHARLDPGIQEGDTITQGQYMGTIAPAGEAASGSSAHLHITIWETDDEGNWSRRAIPFTGRVAIEGASFPATGAGNDYLGYTFNP